MPASNFRLLCSALGFTSVLLKTKIPEKNRASHAVKAAQMIEDFCRSARPELFGIPEANDNPAEIDHLIEALKWNMKNVLEARLPSDLEILHQLYERLIQRHRAYATDDLIADASLHFLDEEIQNEADAAMIPAAGEGNEAIVEVCKKMGKAIQRIQKKSGECSKDDLRAEGFSEEDINRYWSMAFALARVTLWWLDS